MNFGTVLRNFFPRRWFNSGDSAIITALGAEFDLLDSDLEEFRQQLLVASATVGLSEWETIFNLPSNSAMTYEERRSIILSRIRGFGAPTVAKITNVARAYIKNARVVEAGNVYLYQLIIESSETALLQNVMAMLKAVDVMKPAHLMLGYRYCGTTWDDLDALNLSWDEIERFVWNDFDVDGRTWDEQDALDLTWDQTDDDSWDGYESKILWF